MSRIAQRFAELKAQGRKAFIPFISAGDPDFETSLAILEKLIGFDTTSRNSTPSPTPTSPSPTPTTVPAPTPTAPPVTTPVVVPTTAPVTVTTVCTTTPSGKTKCK